MMHMHYSVLNQSEHVPESAHKKRRLPTLLKSILNQGEHVPESA